MATLPPSASEIAAFDRLHPQIRRWIWEQNWSELRDVQEKTIRAVLEETGDVLVAAATAAGKTEAAFLPVLTRIAEHEGGGLSALYVGPLKALINDQFRRLEPLCERLDIPVVRWHGDAPAGAKAKVLGNPAGIALITPESIEALLVRKPEAARRLFGGLEFIVIDELHAFLQGPRGLHLASLLRRIDALADKRPRRVGLSATIGDLTIAARWLNWEDTANVHIIEARTGSPELKLQIRGYEEPADVDFFDIVESDEPPVRALDGIGDHMFDTLRGSNNLVFGGSRKMVEAITDRLQRRAERHNVPNEFFAHHGSLSRHARHEVEARLKQGDLPTTAVATTTLELGIDLGSVVSVAQVGAPRSLASLRQRLGRSGRRKGAPAILRIYCRAPHLFPESGPLDRLRLDLVQAIASIQLLVERFIEPPEADPANVTVALHQTLSIIAAQGGARADTLYRAICGTGPLSALSTSDYAELLRAMAAHDPALLEQAPDRTIMLGPEGERLTTSRDFYAIFPTDQEWRLVAGDRFLGTIPLFNEVGPGSILLFAGRRWRVETVDEPGKVLQVVQHRAGKVPLFADQAAEPVHDRLVAQMRNVLLENATPPYLDAEARRMLAEARKTFLELRLESCRLLPEDEALHLFTWRGSKANALLALAFLGAGVKAWPHDVGITLEDTSLEEARSLLKHMATTPPPTSQALAEFIESFETAKYDDYAPVSLLRRLWARDHTELTRMLPAMARAVLDAVD
ncbi:DEAD/DEAH box helicase [Stappia sp. ES.058]|uniref:DEAD/DEAH box helicase n=1 Tax=Stappia sp. ES.058 TaxID=1881061 RepID=UPI00087D144D|nr:DEAD/DEAH box helicase [Stappia sp. ES.058]SDT88010.1 ATP-dependent helicase Lhr and Lhr-like helicase [Stappia sp. ES.058]SDU49680.1 ATP-dependent helicase Lhr and Lhr-like helicase [Stappia sp. ES.058]